MKRSFIVLFTLISSWSYAQKQINVKATVEAATVYTRGAELVSTVKVTIPSAGQHMVVVENLSSTADERTVQAVAGSNGITILSAVYSVNYIKGKEENPEYKLIRDSLEILKNELSRITNQKTTYGEEQNMILSNKVVSGQNTGLSVMELQKNADFFRVRLLQVKNEITSLEQKEIKVAERLNKYRQQIARFDNYDNMPLGELRILVETAAPVTAPFQISYFMPNAGWSPVYDIRVKDVSQQPVLKYKAEVYQTSGINWKDVKLVISSANPTVSGDKPVLYPWYLAVQTPGKRKAVSTGLMQKSAEAPQPAMESMQSFEGDEITVRGSRGPSVTVTEGQMSVLFDIKERYDIPTDGQQQLVSLNEHTLKSTYQYFTVPKLDKDAFLIARVTEWEGLQLLPGNANVFFENAFVGQSWLDPGMTEDTLELSLGRDKKIIVERKVIKDYERVKTIGTNKKQTSAYEFSIRNTKSVPVDIIVADQVPISSQSEIEVDREELSGGSFKEETGEVRWKMNIAPAETKKFRFIYSVKYPKGKRINM